MPIKKSRSINSKTDLNLFVIKYSLQKQKPQQNSKLVEDFSDREKLVKRVGQAFNNTSSI